MRKALGCTILSVTLACGLAMPAAALPGADGPGDSQPATVQASGLSPTAAAKLRPTLALGSRSPAVVYVQQALGVNPASGYYGELTRAAVLAAQKANGLKATGRVTKSTWKVLLATSGAPAAVKAVSPEAAAKRKPTLKLGSRSPAVVYVQNKLGVTPASGYYGELTRAAVRALQKANGLRVTGRVTKSTWKVLLAAKGVIALPIAATPEADPAVEPDTAASADAPPTPDASATDPAATDPASTEPAATDPAATPTLTPEQAAAARPLLKVGLGPDDPAVVFVQQYLGVTPATGYFGSKTKKAVRAYQAGLGIRRTGKVGPLTWEAIAAGRKVTDATTPAPASPAPVSPAPATTAPAAATPNPGTIATPTHVLPANPAARDLALVFALAQVGKPYVLGGNGPDVFDCSGLVQQAYLSAGVRLPRLASQQRFAGTKVSLEELLPGDLLYYQDGSSPRRGHISMYAGNGLAVEAANPRRGVRVRALQEAWYRDRFVAAVRIG